MRAAKSAICWAPAQSLRKQPEKLTLALETLFRLQAVESQVNSLVDGVRRYQNPAVGDLLVSVVSANSANRDQLRQYVTDLAQTKEQEFQIVDQEAQRCRGTLMRQPPARPAPAAPKPAAAREISERIDSWPRPSLSSAASATSPPPTFASTAPRTPAPITSARNASAAATAASAISGATTISRRAARHGSHALKLIEMQFLAESLIELITQTSTNLPPDVRAAMSRALGTETAQHAVLAGAEHHRLEHRHGGRGRRPDLPGHRHAHLRGAHAGRRQSDRAQEARFRKPSPKPPGAASCAPIRSIRSPARTAATIWARRRR